MTFSANVFWLVILGLILIGVLCVICYQLGKAEGRDQARYERYERRRNRR